MQSNQDAARLIFHHRLNQYPRAGVRNTAGSGNHHRRRVHVKDQITFVFQPSVMNLPLVGSVSLAAINTFLML